MLKKLMSFLFEEEEEEIYSDEGLEEAIFKDVPTSASPSQVAFSPKEEMKQSTSFTQPKPTRSAQQTAPSFEQPRKFTSIDLEPKRAVTESKPAARHRSVSSEAATTARTEKVRSDYNPAPIISPIFGSSESNKVTEKQPSSITGLPKRKHTIGVISPMYGMSEPQEEPVKKTPKRRHAMVSKEETEERAVMEEKEYPNIPLEDILKKDEDLKDDSMQISLFGEDAPIHEESSSDLKIEE